jgi:hypothetical protein
VGRAFLLLLPLAAAAQESTPERERLEAAAKKILDAQDGGKPDEAWKDARAATAHAKGARTSDHFRIQGDLAQADMERILRVAEAARAMYLDAFAPPVDRVPRRIELMYFATHAGYREWALNGYPGTAERRAALADAGGAFHGSPAMAASYGNVEFLREMAAHQVSHVLMYLHFRQSVDFAWLHEASAHRASRVLCLTSTITCGIMEGEGMQTAKVAENSPDWNDHLRRRISEGKDVSPETLEAARWNAIGGEVMVKGWSLLEWLIRESPAGVKAFVGSCAEGQAPDWRACFGKPAAELNEAWRQWLVGE